MSLFQNPSFISQDKRQVMLKSYLCTVRTLVVGDVLLSVVYIVVAMVMVITVVVMVVVWMVMLVVAWLLAMLHRNSSDSIQPDVL